MVLSPVSSPDLESRPVVESHNRSPVRRARTLMLAGGGYLALSLFIWSGVWTSHPTSVTTCGCGDQSLFTWFIEWAAFALRHGLNPFFSTTINYPGGANMLANTSVLAIGLVLAPVTWLFGPVASMNVAATLAPVLSALAMFVLLRRWLSWTPAAFVGGLFYGFSPFILVALSWEHLMLGMAAVPPLMLICLDELLIRQRLNPYATGVGLGLLVALQFFIGTELLLIVVIMGATALLIVIIFGAWRHPDVVRDRARHAAVGLSAGVVTAILLLSYPAWFAVAGPAHFSGPVWSAAGAPNGIPTSATSLAHYVFSSPADHAAASLDHQGGGYQGPILSDQYFGFGTLLVVIGGCIIWRRDRRLWLFGAISIISVVLSLGIGQRVWLPWRLVASLPEFDDIYPYRIVFVTYFAVAVMLGLILDHVYLDVSRRAAKTQVRGSEPVIDRWWTRSPRWAGRLAGVVVAGIALAPPAVYLAQTIPITTRSVDLPNWFRSIAPHLGGHQVLLVFPKQSGTGGNNDNPMTWQSVGGMHFAMVGMGGPSGIVQRAGRERRGDVVIDDASAGTGPPGSVEPGDVQAVRRALDEWGVTMVVVPDQRSLPTYDRISSVTFAAALITAATGERPVHQADAWVWSRAGPMHPVALPTDAQLSECVRGLATHTEVAVTTATRCVLGEPAVGRPVEGEPTT